MYAFVRVCILVSVLRETEEMGCECLYPLIYKRISLYDRKRRRND